MKKLLKGAALSGALTLLSAFEASAASQFFDFTNGNTGGWNKLQYTIPNQGAQNAQVQFVQRNIKSRPWGFVCEAARVADRNLFGGDIVANKGMNGGFISSRIKLQFPDVNAWGGWWAWNNKRGANNLLEVDVVEHVGESGGKIIQNYYWTANGSGNAVGKKGPARPLSWVNNWAIYSAQWANQGNSVTFRRNGAVTTFTGGGQARPNADAKLRFNHQPWPFNNSVFGGFRIYALLQVDSAYWQD